MSRGIIINKYLVFILVSIFSGCITKVTVNWIIATNSIVLGSDLQLVCRVTGYDRHKSSALKRWTGGSDDHDICTDNKCIKEDKYEMQNDESTPSFNLTIKHVDEIDMKESFTCWYNFESSSGNIISKKDIIIFDRAMINKQASDHIINGNLLDVNLTLDKVYPIVQNCSGIVEYDKFTITLDKSLNTQSSKLPSGLYRAEIYGTLELPQVITECFRVLKLTCSFSSKLISIFAMNNTQCRPQESAEANDMIVPFLAGFLVLSVLMVLVLFINCRRRSMQKKRYKPVPKEETPNVELQEVNGTTVKKLNANKRLSKNARRRRKDKRRFQTHP